MHFLILKLNILSLLTLILAFSSLKAQSPFFFYQYTTDDGLRSNADNDHFFQDSQGNIWISTPNGLIKYDGQAFHIFRPDANDSLAISHIQVQSQLYEDQIGRLWFNTKTNLEYYDPKHNGFFQVKIAKQKGYEQDFHIFHYDEVHKAIWFVGEKGEKKYPLYTLSTQKPFLAVCIDSLDQYIPNGGMQMVSFDSNRLTLLLPKSNSLEIREYTFAKNKWIPQETPAFEINLRPFSFYAVKSDSIWVGTDQGLALVSLTHQKLQIVNKKLKDVKGIVPFDDEYLLVGTSIEGLFFVKKSNPSEITPIVFLDKELESSEANPIHQLYLDRDRNLWVATKANGIYMSPLDRRSSVSKMPDLVNTPIKGIAEDNSGDLWLLSPKGLIHTDKNGKIIPLSKKQSALNESIFEREGYSLHDDAQGNIWFCTFSGLYVKTPEQDEFNLVQGANSQEKSKQVFTHFMESKSGKRIATSFRKGLSYVEQKNGQFHFQMTQANNKSATYMYSFENKEGDLFVNIWPKGIIIFPQGSSLTSPMDDTLKYSSLIYGMSEDIQTGNIWVGGQEGLHIISKRKGKYLMEKDEIFSEKYPIVYGLLTDIEGRLWASTDDGMILYSPKENQQTSSRSRPKNIFHRFDQSYGFADQEFLPKSFIKNNKGIFLVGSPNGLSRFDPMSMPFDSFQSITKVSSILSNNLPLKTEQQSWKEREGTLIPKLNLYDADKTVEITFLNNEEYGDEQTFAYKYLLKSIRGEIINTADDNVARFINMKPGSYILEMYSTNSQRQWGKPDYIFMEVHPHWTATNWFRVGIFTMILAVITIIFRNRIRLAESRQEIAESKQEIAEFKLLNAEIESAVQRLKMNPHFIFNSLNAIRDYIQKADVELADNFLMNFSNLIRKVLKLSDKVTVSLHEEIEFLTTYLAIEELRFEHAFTYNFQIPDDLNLDDTAIPTMILQPFIENAIIHGFKNLTYPGKIEISFELQGEDLHCVVKDNGRGRNHTSAQPSAHQSESTRITRERLKLIEEKTGRKTFFKIIDHRDPMGTEVNLTIPMEA